jgi:hypothetical protein
MVASSVRRCGGRPLAVNVALHQRLTQWPGQRADLVDLAQQAVGRLAVERHLDTFDIGYHQVVSYELDAIADTFDQQRPVVPVSLVGRPQAK